MRILSTIVLAVALCFGVGFAQEMPGQGSKAFFAYYGYQVSGFGLRYWMQPSMVIVPGINFSISNSTIKGQGGYSDATNNTTTFGVSVAVESHMAPVGPVSPFFAGGLSFTSTSNTQKPSLASGTIPNGTNTEIDYSSTPFGVFGGLGLEAYIDKNVSVGFQYQVNVSFGGGKYTYKYQGNPDITAETSTFGLNLGTTNVWVSVLF